MNNKWPNTRLEPCREKWNSFKQPRYPWQPKSAMFSSHLSTSALFCWFWYLCTNLSGHSAYALAICWTSYADLQTRLMEKWKWHRTWIWNSPPHNVDFPAQIQELCRIQIWWNKLFAVRNLHFFFLLKMYLD